MSGRKARSTVRVKPIRRWLRRELGLPKQQVSADGSWKRGVANLDHHLNQDDD